ncbi:MAG: hypothetical protein WBG00_13780 [Thermoanaerobaculia bacterium]|jgi:hypothetical protein
MPKYLVEVPHPDTEAACARIIKTFLETGSHYLTNAEWGCMDGTHSAWMIVETADKEAARSIVPPPYRSDARVVTLSRFTIEQVDAILAKHGE